MNQLRKLCVLLLALLALSSCKEEKKTNIIITQKPKPTQPSRPQKMGDYQQTRKVEWLGSTYSVEMKLEAVDSLPLAKDGNKQYYDNRVTVTINRADGSQFFKRSFTKSYFKPYVEENYYKDGALLGVVFVKADGNDLCFAASVGSPDKSSDEYVPLVLKISNHGAISVSKDTQLDTGSDFSSEEEDEDGV